MLVEAYELKKIFGKRSVVEGVNLKASKGDVVAFLGCNGSGKSTILRMISGFLEPDQGKVSICGYDMHADPVKAKEFIGYLPENYFSYMDFSPAILLDFIGNARGLSKKFLRDRINFLVDALDFADYFYKPIRNLSTGLKKRVLIAQTVLHDPSVLILDEPTSGLDPLQRNELYSMIHRICHDKAFIFSTHMIDEVQTIASRVVRIFDGRVVDDSKAADFFDGLKDIDQNGFSILRVSGLHIDAVKDNLSKIEGIVSVEEYFKQNYESGLGYHSVLKIGFSGNLSDLRGKVMKSLYGKGVKADLFPSLDLRNNEIFSYKR